MSNKEQSQARVINASIDLVEFVDSHDLYGVPNETEKVYALLQAASMVATRINCGDRTWKQFVIDANKEAIDFIAEINDPDLTH